jgi:hypothetical protein
MDLVPFTNTTPALTGGTIVAAVLSGVTILASTLSGNTILNSTSSGGTHVGGTFSGNTIIGPTISGGTAIGITLTGSTFLGGSISGSTITAAGGALSGTTLNAPVGSGGTWVAGTFSGTTLIGPIISGGTAKTLTLTGTTLFSGPVIVSGNTITNPSGIIFSNETLSQYDEGSWTPVIAGDGTAGTQTYSVQSGKFVRIGKQVWCEFSLTMTAKDGTTAGNIYIGGLPFTVSSATNYRGSGYFGAWVNLTMAAGYTQLGLRAGTSSTIAYITQSGSASAENYTVAANIAATTELRGTIEFEI